MPEGRTSWFSPAWVKILLALIGAVLIGVFAYYGYQYYLLQNLSEKLPDSGETIAFTDRGIADTFLMSEFSFNRAVLERVGDVTILESRDMPQNAGKRVVLAQKDNTSGVILGVVSAGVFEALLSDGTNKSDLAVTADGTAVFAVAARPAFFPEDIPAAAADDTKDSTEPDEVGSAEGPVKLIVAPVSDVREKNVSTPGGIFAFDINDKKLRSLGRGKSPRPYGSDAVIAIASEGVVVVDVGDGSRVTLISYRGGDASGSALSPNGTIAALRREGSSTVEFFRIAGGMGVYLGQIFSASPMYGTAILGEGHIFVRTGKDTVALYALSDNVSAVTPQFAELGLLMPN